MIARKGTATTVFLGITLIFATPRLHGQSCQDERGMADAMVKAVADVVDTVKKESQSDFDSKFHQKSCLNKLTFAISAVGEVVSCLEKAGSDATSASAKDTESKLKDKLSGYKTSLKAADDPKAAKQLIGTFDLSAGQVTAASTKQP
jgi:hypothetical protein